jgi:hypothetical protein
VSKQISHILCNITATTIPQFFQITFTGSSHLRLRISSGLCIHVYRTELYSNVWSSLYGFLDVPVTPSQIAPSQEDISTGHPLLRELSMAHAVVLRPTQSRWPVLVHTFSPFHGGSACFHPLKRNGYNTHHVYAIKIFYLCHQCTYFFIIMAKKWLFPVKALIGRGYVNTEVFWAMRDFWLPSRCRGLRSFEILTRRRLVAHYSQLGTAHRSHIQR